MEQMLIQQQIPLLIFLIIGLTIGTIATWLVLRNRIKTAVAQATSENQIEIARLNERLSSAQEDIKYGQTALREADHQLTVLREQLDSVRNERAQLAERASRVSLLEEQLATRNTELSALHEEVAKISAQLAARTQSLETLAQRLQATMTANEAERGKLEELQMRLQEESNRSAALAEQAAQLPEHTNRISLLEQQLQTRYIEQNSIQEELTRVSAQLAERTQAIEASEERLKISTIAQAADREKCELLQSKLQEETNRSAALAEQAAQLPEHANRISLLEQQLETRYIEQNSIQEELTRVSAQLAERTQAIEALEERLKISMAAQATDREKGEFLQSKLQEETKRSATLAEQAARLPELLEKLSNLEAEQIRLNQSLADQREKVGSSETMIANQAELLNQLNQEKQDLSTVRDELTAEQQRLTTRIAELTTTLESERSQGQEKLLLLNEAKEQLSNQFKTLASEIMEDKAKRFTEQNQTNLDQILLPLKTKLQEFQGKVEEVYVQEGKDRTALAEQVKQLMTLNQQLSQDAHNLTRALKGQAKAQGNWGELILERVLETSGLSKGIHYEAQESHSREDGSRAQPDVIIRLPEGKHLVVDAKVSLVAYDEYVNADSDKARESALKRHLDSVRIHIKGLSSKNYQELYQLKSLDFVLMFVPVEPAFMLAISQDSELWQDAWAKNVLLVSPSTFLFVVRTVAHLWRQEQQNRNAQDIAKRGGELYDKLVGFVEDLVKLGDRLDQAKDSYDKAYGKFTTGRGNVIRQAEMLKELGVKPSKSLQQPLIEIAQDSDISTP